MWNGYSICLQRLEILYMYRVGQHLLHLHFNGAGVPHHMYMVTVLSHGDTVSMISYCPLVILCVYTNELAAVHIHTCHPHTGFS